MFTKLHQYLEQVCPKLSFYQASCKPIINLSVLVTEHNRILMLNTSLHAVVSEMVKRFTQCAVSPGTV